MAISNARITSNTSYYLVALTLQKLLAFGYFIVIARFLGAEDLGRYALAVSFIQILAIFIDSGLSPAITREASRDPKKITEHFAPILGFKLIMSIAAALLLFALAHLFGYSALVRQLLYLAGVVMILDSFTLSFYAMLRGLHVLKNESVAVVIYQLIVITISMIGLYAGAGVHILIIALIVASLGNFLWSLYSLTQHVSVRMAISLQNVLLRRLMHLALPFGITALFIKLYQLGDTILLSLLADEIEVGIYSVAHKLVFAFEFIPLAVVASIFPAMSALFQSDSKAMQRTFEASSFYLMLIATPIALGGFVLSHQMIISLYGDEFLRAVPSLEVLLVCLPFLFLNYPLSSLLGAINKQHINMYFMGCTALSSLLLNLWLIPKYGGLGASIALLISLSALFIAYVYYIHMVIGVTLRKYFLQFAKVILLSVVMAGGVVFLSGVSAWWVSAAVGVALYLGLGVFTNIISKADLAMAARGFKRSV